MRINKILTLLFAVPLLFAACTKVTFVVGEHPFELTVKNICAEEAWLDIIPENNDFHYYAYVVKKSEFFQYTDDSGFINATHRYLLDTYESCFPGGGKARFLDLFLFKESYYFAAYELEPDTDYYLFAYPYDRNGEPMMNLSKVEFRTASQIRSDIKFTVSLEGSVVHVTPSNSDQYFWEYESVKTVEEDYLNSPSLYYRAILNVYTEHDILPSMMSRGNDSEDMKEHYTLQPGDEFFIILSGYDRGVTSDPEIYRMVYKGEGQTGTVTPYTEDSAQS